MNFYQEIIVALQIGTIIFVAGGGWVRDKQTRKDLNGLGTRVREDRAAEDFRFWTTAVLEIALTKRRKDRKWLAERILEAAKRKL